MSKLRVPHELSGLEMYLIIVGGLVNSGLLAFLLVTIIGVGYRYWVPPVETTHCTFNTADSKLEILNGNISQLNDISPIIIEETPNTSIVPMYSISCIVLVDSSWP